MRNLTKSIAVVSILAPASVYSLGIGEIKLHSALNQNLNAEIALIVSADEAVTDINVRLASPDKFDEAGVPWSYFLSKIKFESITKADGSVVIKLSSNEVLREPFLDFLLEVNWPKGNLYREFTVLVDPPAAYTQPIIPIVQKAIQEPKQTTQKDNIELIDTVAVNTEAVLQYGPTSASDTLWKIAEETNTNGKVSIEQMMIAIYEANPKAFYKDNINALMAEKTLDIPEKNVILRLSQKEALKEFKRQEKTWKGRVSTKAQAKPIEPEELEIHTQLELQAPLDEEVSETEVIIEAEPLIKSPEEKRIEETDGLVVESSDENLTLIARLEKLEKNLLIMQKMLVMKDEQIAALQSQQKNNILSTKKITNEEKNADQHIAVKDKTQAESIAEPKVESIPKNVTPPPATITPTVQTEPEPGFLSGLLTPILAAISIIILGFLGWLWSRKRVVEKETDSESMFATASEISLPDSLEDSSVSMMDDTASYEVGTVGESSFLSEFTPSDFDAFDTDQNEVDPVSEADVYLAYGRYQQAEDLMRQAIADQPDRDECKLKLLEIFYANENKTAFEEFATELVDLGKQKDFVFWAKVAEMGVEMAPESSLFTDQENTKVDFNTTDASADEVDETEKTLTDIDENKDASEGLDFDLSVFDETADEGELEEQEVVSELDFDLSTFEKDDITKDVVDEDDVEAEVETVSFENKEEKDTEQPEINTINALDFNGAGGESNHIEEIAEESSDSKSATENDINDELDSFDFSLDNEVPESASSDPSKPETELNDLEELDGFDFSLDNETPETASSEISGSTTEVDDIEGFDFDFDTEIDTSSPSDALESLDDSVSDLTDMDELETKIDLAKAYIDMGDMDAARGIADEVMEKGNDDQKATAQSIIDQLK